MKQLLVLSLLFICCKVFSQDTTKVEQYCEVLATQNTLNSRPTISVDYGDDSVKMKEKRLKDDSGNLKKFNSVVNVLNDLGKHGWKLVSACADHAIYNPIVIHYVLKKEVLRSELEK